MKAVFLGLLLGAAGAPIYAAGGDGNHLLSGCNSLVKLLDKPQTRLSDDALISSGYCLGTVSSVVSVMSTFRLLQGEGETKFKTCIPANSVPNAQAARIVIKYLTANPATLHWPGTGLAMLALREAFPCD